MKSLRRLTVSIALTCVFGVHAQAQLPCNPGETHGPPCPVATPAPVYPTNSGQTATQPASTSVNTGTLVEIALVNLLMML